MLGKLCMMDIRGEISVFVPQAVIKRRVMQVVVGHKRAMGELGLSSAANA